MPIIKPPVLPPWADSGDKVQPSNAELQAGWPLSGTPPSRQRFNWILNYLANAARYFSRRGIPDYDVAETYMIGDRIIGDDGKTYRSLQDNNTAHTPSSATTWWEEWAPTLARFAALIQGQTYTAFTTAGTAPNFSLTPSPAIAAYAAGQRFRVKFHAAGAGADQLNVNTRGNKALKQYDSTGVKVAAVVAANQLVDVEYDGVDMVLIDPLPATPGMSQAAADARYCNIGYLLVQHQLAQGTDAGNLAAGIQTRPLNTVVANTLSGASLASNQVTLPAGTYRVHGEAVAWHCNGSKIALYNVTDAAYIQQGLSINGENTLGDLMAWQISLDGRFTLAATKVLELRQFAEIASTAGFGKAVNSMGVEVYATLEIVKES